MSTKIELINKNNKLDRYDMQLALNYIYILY